MLTSNRIVLCLVILFSVINPAQLENRSKTASNNDTLQCSGERKSSFLWRINTSPPSYFFGSVHVPYTRVWNYISENVKQAFMRANKIYFELDLTDPYTIHALTTCQLLPRGTNLTQVLPRGIFNRLENHLRWVRGEMDSWLTPDQRVRGLHPDHLFNAITANWVRKRPIWAMLMVYSLTPSDIASRGFPVLDLYLAQLANKYKKGKGAVETVEDQCGPINGLSLGQVVFALNQTLQEQEIFRSGVTSPVYTTEKIVNSYKCGEIDSFSMFSSEYSSTVPLLTPKSGLSKEQEQISEEINQYFKDHLINRRNKRMSSRVIELLLNNRGQSFFFVFGAGHFVGNYSIIHLVRKSGFQVEEVGIDDDLDAWTNSKYPSGYSMSPGRVAGTFHDLSDEEKTKAFLQLLQHQLKVEKERGGNKKSTKVNELWQNLPAPDLYSNESDDVNAVRESVKIWYGLSNAASGLSTFPAYLKFYTLFYIINRAFLLQL
eukprot:TRINITY_DN15894_c0_g1_i2.p1 TRINITY_DN15894_c0_g1~~TRINITY_DN15894_c0_g1_i2.p1  ORF type:complete len:488 (-),score=49.75 TRINITY_DN15894_c0_g1_i2:119-1582(-)